MAIRGIVTTIKTIEVTTGAIVGTTSPIVTAIATIKASIAAIDMSIIAIEATIRPVKATPAAPQPPIFHAAATPEPPMVGRCSCLVGVIARRVPNPHAFNPNTIMLQPLEQESRPLGASTRADASIARIAPATPSPPDSRSLATHTAATAA